MGVEGEVGLKRMRDKRNDVEGEKVGAKWGRDFSIAK